MTEHRLVAAVVLQYKVLVNVHDLPVSSLLLSEMSVDSNTFGTDSDFLYLFIMLLHFHTRTFAAEDAFTKSTMVLSCEDGELLEALVAELDVLVRQHPWLLRL